MDALGPFAGRVGIVSDGRDFRPADRFWHGSIQQVSSTTVTSSELITPYHISQSERNVIISLDLGTITSSKAFHKTLELGASFGDHTVVPTNPCPRTCNHTSYPLNLCFITSVITASTFTVPPLVYLRNIQIHQRYRPPTHIHHVETHH